MKIIGRDKEDKHREISTLFTAKLKKKKNTYYLVLYFQQTKLIDIFKNWTNGFSGHCTIKANIQKSNVSKNTLLAYNLVKVKT